MSTHLAMAGHEARTAFARGAIFVVAAVIALLFLSPVAASQDLDQTSADGPVSVNLGDVFKKGNTRIEEADLKRLPSLPPGFVALNNKAYRIITDAEAVGPYTVAFSVRSVTDEESFHKLRILHIEPDRFDPESGIWVDRTASLPDAPGADFTQKKIYAYSKELEQGIYVVARSTGKPASADAVADLEVIARGAPESVQMPANLTVSVTIKNNGPQVANDVGALEQLIQGNVVSAKPSQGTCKQRAFRLYCKLGQLSVGSSATIEVVIDPSRDFAGSYSTFFEVAAREADSRMDNNQTEATVLAHPDPNVPPDVELNTPATDQLFEQGASVALNATATDPDGSVTKVEFFDNEKSLGIGSSSDARHFSLNASAFSNGPHVVVAVATDNGGRRKRSNTKHIFVNGPTRVRILEPKAESLVTPGSDLTLTAEARHPNGSIRTLEFFTVGISLGQAKPIAGDHFMLKLPDVKRARYLIEAVATDESGLVSKSPPLELKVSNRPTIRIATPAEGASLMAPVNVEIILNPDSLEYGRRVEVYANGALIEQGPIFTSIKYAFTWKDAQAGKYELKAVVVDVIGVKGESSPVNIVVKDRGVKNE